MGRGGIGDDDEVLSHAENAPALSHKVCMATGFLCPLPTQKSARWEDKFWHEHFSTNLYPIRGRRVCKKGKGWETRGEGGHTMAAFPRGGARS